MKGMKGFDDVERKLLAFLRAGIDDDRWPAGWLMADDVLQRVARACAANRMMQWAEMEQTRDRIVERFRELRIFDEDDPAVISRPGTPPLNGYANGGTLLDRFHHVSADRLAAAMDPKAGDRPTQRELIALALWHWHVDTGNPVPLTTEKLMEAAECKEPAVAKALAAFFGKPGRAKYVDAVDINANRNGNYMRLRLKEYVPDRYRRDESVYGEQWSDDLAADDEETLGNDDESADADSNRGKERNRPRKIREKI